jgi:uncharacterized protein (TIGR03067 family)
MKPLAAGLVAVLCLSPAFADDDAKGDLAKLQGKWKAMIGPDMKVPLVLELKGNAASLTLIPTQGPAMRLSGEIKIDDKAKPKAWDFVNVKDSDGGDTGLDDLAIYEIDGDTLKVCSGGLGGPRPTEIKAADNGPPYLVSYTRVKDADKDKDKNK